MKHNYSFTGEFRTYQKRVLDRIDDHLKDRKVHIVAAPGSGKTILGLEIICRLGEPALILSPTVTIQHQWGSRLAESFLYPLDDISYSIKTPKSVTSITYQALHAATKRENMSVEIDDEQDLEFENDLNFSEFDLFAVIKNAGIKVICVDEAHHLKQEWQKSLEAFMKRFEDEMIVIALTATPPYDSTAYEWERYISICGEIDEEISIPELVKQYTLCPHQDYVMFNYPTDTEKQFIKAYSDKAFQAVKEIHDRRLIHSAADNYGLLVNYELKTEQILDNPAAFAGILMLLKRLGVTYPKGLLRLITPTKKLPDFTLENLEITYRYIVSHSEEFGVATTKEIASVFRDHGLMYRKNVQLVSDPNNSRVLISSLGKLKSIVDIARHELNTMQDSLRMLVLTDFIRKEHVGIIGAHTEINTMGLVPIFESLRRNIPKETSIAALSGSLVILKTSLENDVERLSTLLNFEYTKTQLRGSDYSEYTISGKSKVKVGLITQLFQEGKITILVGTKSLLGEGWDSPVINTLILASFVGSFMLSNQMRGRAIRLDPQTPDKVSNIWHLVTLPPPSKHDGNTVVSVGSDYETLERRFMNFFAPNQEGTRIEVGLGRLGITRELISRKEINAINQIMLDTSSQRTRVRDYWKSLLGTSDTLTIAHQIEVVPPKQTPLSTQFILINILSSFVISTIITGILYVSLFRNLRLSSQSSSSLISFLILIIMSVVSQFAWHFGGRKRKMKAVSNAIYETLSSMGVISKWAAPYIETNEDKTALLFSLQNANDKESHEYAKAISEFFSILENPRYVLYQVRLFGIKDTYNSFACPSIIATKQEYVQTLVRCLKHYGYHYGYAYTRNAEGRKILIKCRDSYATHNQYLQLEKKVVKQYKKSKSWR